MLELTGKFKHNHEKIWLEFPLSFCLYYKSLIEKRFCELKGKLFIPRYGAHCNLAISRFNKINNLTNCAEWNGVNVVCYYNAHDLREGGRDFRMFYFPLNIPVYNQIVSSCKIETFAGNDWGPHVTICSNKYGRK